MNFYDEEGATKHIPFAPELVAPSTAVVSETSFLQAIEVSITNSWNVVVKNGQVLDI
ncbi:MAG: hypothetical protein GQ540_06345 [Lutibacter sp.]|uniref:hypothetical protein n=1 Tax=Lutibacter sp. TaxID=1925666 RepID=UPI0019E1110C|nr:hypothetical protein [Lutibacter sp.]NOR28132.1 hypothetical protein [Lutibacter sp.]